MYGEFLKRKVFGTYPEQTKQQAWFLLVTGILIMKSYNLIGKIAKVKNLK